MQKCDWRGRVAHSGSKKRLPCLRCRMEKKFATPLRRECHFCEKTHRTAAADGVAHRILENVTFERRESRATPPLAPPFRAAFLALLDQDDGSLHTNSLKLHFYSVRAGPDTPVHTNMQTCQLSTRLIYMPSEMC